MRFESVGALSCCVPVSLNPEPQDPGPNFLSLSAAVGPANAVCHLQSRGDIVDHRPGGRVRGSGQGRHTEHRDVVARGESLPKDSERHTCLLTKRVHVGLLARCRFDAKQYRLVIAHVCVARHTERHVAYSYLLRPNLVIRHRILSVIRTAQRRPSSPRCTRCTCCRTTTQSASGR